MAPMNRLTAVIAVNLVLICLVIVGAPSMGSASSKVMHAADPAYGQEYIDYVIDTAEEYRQMTGNRVEVITGTRDQVITWTAAGVLPDVISVMSDYVTTYIKLGTLRDLTPFFERDDSVNIDDFFPLVVKAFTAIGDRTGLFAVPRSFWNINSGVNLIILHEMGLESPNNFVAEAWNWDMIKNYARKITRDINGDGHIDQYGIHFSGWIHRWAMLFRHAGSPMFDRDFDPTRVNLDTPEALSTVEFMREIHEREWVGGGGFYKGNIGINYGDAGPNFGHISRTHLGEEVEVDFIPNPMGPGGSNGTEVQAQGYGITTASQDPAAAWDWLRYLLCKEDVVKRYSIITGRPPVLAGLGAWYVEEVLRLPHANIVVDSLGYYGSGFRPILRDLKVFSIIEQHIRDAIYGRVSPVEALEHAHRLGNIALQESRGQY